MNIVGWVVWGIACGWTVFSCVAFVNEVFWPQLVTAAQPRDARVFFSPQIKRLISGIYVVGMIAALFVTGIWGISKLHLLWFTPFWHFFGTQWIAIIYERAILRSMRGFSSDILGNIVPSNALKDMYENYKGEAKALREKGYSKEETFWICFAIMSLHPFFEEEDAKVLGIENEIRLSQILERQLAIYCEEVNREMKAEDVPLFLNLLREKFDHIRKIVHKSDDCSSAPHDLCFVLYHLCGENNIVNAVSATLYILTMSNELFDKSKPLRLVRDI